VAERSGDTAFIFAWARMIYFAEVMQTGAWVAIGAQTLPPKAVSPLRSAVGIVGRCPLKAGYRTP